MIRRGRRPRRPAEHRICRRKTRGPSRTPAPTTDHKNHGAIRGAMRASRPTKFYRQSLRRAGCPHQRQRCRSRDDSMTKRNRKFSVNVRQAVSICTMHSAQGGAGTLVPAGVLFPFLSLLKERGRRRPFSRLRRETSPKRTDCHVGLCPPRNDRQGKNGLPHQSVDWCAMTGEKEDANHQKIPPGSHPGESCVL